MSEISNHPMEEALVINPRKVSRIGVFKLLEGWADRMIKKNGSGESRVKTRRRECKDPLIIHLFDLNWAIGELPNKNLDALNTFIAWHLTIETQRPTECQKVPRLAFSLPDILLAIRELPKIYLETLNSIVTWHLTNRGENTTPCKYNERRCRHPQRRKAPGDGAPEVSKKQNDCRRPAQNGHPNVCQLDNQQLMAITFKDPTLLPALKLISDSLKAINEHLSIGTRSPGRAYLSMDTVGFFQDVLLKERESLQREHDVLWILLSAILDDLAKRSEGGAPGESKKQEAEQDEKQNGDRLNEQQRRSITDKDPTLLPALLNISYRLMDIDSRFKPGIGNIGLLIRMVKEKKALVCERDALEIKLSAILNDLNKSSTSVQDDSANTSNQKNSSEIAEELPKGGLAQSVILECSEQFAFDRQSESKDTRMDLTEDAKELEIKPNHLLPDNDEVFDVDSIVKEREALVCERDDLDKFSTSVQNDSANTSDQKNSSDIPEEFPKGGLAQSVILECSQQFPL